MTIPSIDRVPVLRRVPPRWMLFSVAVLGLLAMSLWLRAAAPVRTEPLRTAVRPSSLAVLPFVNANPDPADDYLGYGVGSELARALDALPGLRVAARSSSFGPGVSRGDPRAVGRRLNVSTVLEGSVRRAGDRLRVTAHLVDVSEGFDLWSDTYDRAFADLVTVQREMKQAIAGALRIPVAEDSVSRLSRPTGIPEAYDAYLAGTYLLQQIGPEAARDAIAHLNRAIRLDPSFALAHAALAEAYLPTGELEAVSPRVAVPRAQAAALMALKLDSALAGPHVTLGAIRFGFQRNWGAAQAEFRRALALEPVLPEAHQGYSRFLVAMGRLDESVQASETAVRLSPAAPKLIAHLGWNYLHTRQYSQAREALLRAVELDSTDWRPHVDLALLEQATGNYDAALGRLRVPLGIAPERPEVQVALGQVYALSGQADSARAILRRLQEAAKQSYISSYLIGCLQASLGLRVQAFASLDRAIRERSELVPYLRIDPRFDSLRTDRRFSRLLRLLRLP